MREYKLHKNVYIKRVSRDYLALYHPLNAHKVVFIPNDNWHDGLDRAFAIDGVYSDSNLFAFLVQEKFLVPVNHDENLPIRRIRDRLYPQQPQISIMYLILTETCNYRCSYCFIEENIYKLDGAKRNSLMDMETCEHAIDLFIRIAEGDEQQVIIYGGEPLINREVFLYAVRRLREEEKVGKLRNLTIVLNTNASLIDDDIAEACVQFNVVPAVSIDGPPEIHDAVRKYFSGKGTFNSTVLGYETLRSKGIEPAISCTITRHNVSALPEVTRYFVEDLKARNIGFNLLVDFLDIPNQERVEVSDATQKMLEAFEYLRERGVYEDRIMRRLSPFIEGQIFLRECGAYGNQIVVAPDGAVGPCHAFLSSREHFVGSVHDPSFDPRQNETFVRWNQRNPFNMPECWDCPMISLCGGGCAYQASVLHNGDIFQKDDRICEHVKVLLDWAITDLWKHTISHGKQNLKLII